MTVGQLRAILGPLPDDMPITIEIANDGDEPKENEFVQSDLLKADVEERCDEIERLYLWGDAEGENEPEKPELRVVRGGASS